MARPTHHQPKHQGCGPECTYRGLYEGTQASLVDMARRQTEALRRVGRLRSAIVLLLKRHFPQAFSQAEANIGGRLSETDDEVLLAYLAGFVGSSPDGSSEQHILLLRKIALLKAELLEAGVQLTGDDPQLWIAPIRAWKAAQGGPAARAADERSNAVGSQEAKNAANDAQAPTGVERRPGPNGTSPGAVTSSSAATAARTTPAGPTHLSSTHSPSVSPASSSTRSTTPSNQAPTGVLGDLFDDRTATPGQPDKRVGTPDTADSASGKAATTNDSALGQLFDDMPGGSGRSDSAPVQRPTATLGEIFDPADVPQTWRGGIGGTAQDDSGHWVPSPLQPRGASKGTQTAATPDPAGKTMKTAGRSRSEATEEPATHAPVMEGAGERAGNSSSTGTPSSAPEGRESVQWSNPFDAPAGQAPDFDLVDDDRQPSQANTTRSEPSPNAVPTGGATASRGDEDPPIVQPTPTAPPSAQGAAQNQSTPGMAQPLRPELFPTSRPAKTTRRGTKTPRARAERPDPHLLDVPIDYPDTKELSAETRQKLLASSLLPRPVFTSDLVAVAGSSEAVATWEAEMRADPANSPVRFLAAKGRHRLRGSLIVPVNTARELAKSSKSTWWADCVSLYRGSRLYELGVVLNRVGDEVVASKFDEHHAVLRLSSPRGLVGVVIMFDAAVGDEPSRTALKNSLDQLLKERLTLVAVLTSAGEAAALTSLTETVASLALSENWKRTIPVIAARSWEFADDRGSTAQLVFGG